MYHSKNLLLIRMAIYIGPFIVPIFSLGGDFTPRTGIIDNSNLLTVTLFVATSSFALFALRERRRLYYGFLEAAFAFLLLWSAAAKLGALGGAIVAATTFGNDALYALAAAIYVGVRALDNIGQAIDRYPSVYRFWLWLFLYPEEEARAKVEAAFRKWENSAKLTAELAKADYEREVDAAFPRIDLPEQK